MKNFTILLLCLVCSGCANYKKDSNTTAGEYKIDSLVLSADTAIKPQTPLSSVLNFKNFRPTKVLFKMMPVQNGSPVTNKPLEAVVFYDERSYAAILERYMDAGFPKAKFKREEFNFGWMADSLKQELLLSNANYFGNPDIFLGTGGKAKLWFLNKKILVKLD